MPLGQYFIIKQALSRELCEFLAKYAFLRSQIKSKRNNYHVLRNVHREYADSMMEVLLEEIRPMVEEATQKQLWPTLSFYYMYTKGNQLLPHKDRSSCEIVAGLCIGADEKFKKTKSSWPLIINTGSKVEEVCLDYGDLVIFKGHQLEHWRNPFLGEWFVSAIFGYVDKNGPFAFQKYDQRRSLGEKHIGMFWWSYGCIKEKIRSFLSK